MRRVLMHKSMTTVSPKGTTSSYQEGLIYLVSDDLATEWGAGEDPAATPCGGESVGQEKAKQHDEPADELVDAGY